MKSCVRLIATTNSCPCGRGAVGPGVTSTLGAGPSQVPLGAIARAIETRICKFALRLSSMYTRRIVDEELLAQAKRAEERLIEAEQDAEIARAEFHRAVRRLHLNGASLRELAGALRLSHQRIHQIVEAAGGARRWRNRGHSPLELACSFCGRAQRKTRKLVAGPGVYICEACVELAGRVIASGSGVETTLGALLSVSEDETRRRCSFCGKHRHQVTGLATTVDNPCGKFAGDAAICGECLTLCEEIHAERLT
jgi:hypothetical protein